MRSWKRSNDPNFEAKKNRFLELYPLADACKVTLICLNEFGPRSHAAFATPTPPGRPSHARRLQSHPRPPPTATSRNTRQGVEFLAFCRYSRSLHPAEVMLHFILDNFSNADDAKVREVVNTAKKLPAAPLDRQPGP